MASLGGSCWVNPGGGPSTVPPPGPWSNPELSIFIYVTENIRVNLTLKNSSKKCTNISKIQSRGPRPSISTLMFPRWLIWNTNEGQDSGQNKKINKTYVEVLQLESKFTADGHGHVGVDLYIRNIDLGAGPDLVNTTSSHSKSILSYSARVGPTVDHWSSHSHSCKCSRSDLLHALVKLCWR